MTDTSNPLTSVDPDAITALFDADPTLLDDIQLDMLIAEYRRRADVHAAELAAEACAPKEKAKKTRVSKTADPKEQMARDKPIEEVSIEDLDL